jgi:hypothetical protein
MQFLNTTNMQEIYRIPDQTTAIIIREALLPAFATHCNVCHVLAALTGDGFSVVATLYNPFRALAGSKSWCANIGSKPKMLPLPRCSAKPQ